MPGKRRPVSPATIADRVRNDRPIVIRTVKVRAAFVRKKKIKANYCHTIVMTIPAEVAQLVGVNRGDTMMVSGYADGFWVSKGGDLVSAKDAGL